MKVATEYVSVVISSSVKSGGSLPNISEKMAKTNAVIAIAVLLNLCQFHNANAAVKDLKHTYSYPNKKVMYNEYAFKDGNLVYAVCDGAKTESNCTIIQRQYPYDKVTRSCNFTLRPFTGANDDVTDRIYVHAFAQDKAILFWGEMGGKSGPGFDLTIIQLDTCKTKLVYYEDLTQSIYRTQVLAHRLVTYENEFDLFADIKATGTGTDSGRTGTRVVFDGPSQPLFSVIKDDDSQKEYVQFVSSIATRSPAKGYIYSTSGKGPYSLYLVRPDGTKKLLTTSQELYSTIASAEYDMITSCTRSEFKPETTCTHYNENGDVKFNVTVQHDGNKITRRHIVRNSPRGGFILMTSSYDEKIEKLQEGTSYKMVPTSYDVIRVNGEGKTVGSVSLTGFVEKHDYAAISSLWDNGEEYCAALTGKSNQDAVDNLNNVVNCFTESDFTA